MAACGSQVESAGAAAYRSSAALLPDLVALAAERNNLP
jgi:hypothetical protein